MEARAAVKPLAEAVLVSACSAADRWGSLSGRAELARPRMPTCHPVLLCGGSGTRLWPLSRKSFPKQFTAPDRGGDAVSGRGAPHGRPGCGGAHGHHQFGFPVHRDRTTGRGRDRPRADPDRAFGAQHRAGCSGGGAHLETRRSRRADAGHALGSRRAGPRGVPRRGGGRRACGGGGADRDLRHPARPGRDGLWLAGAGDGTATRTSRAGAVDAVCREAERGAGGRRCWRPVGICGMRGSS